MQVNLERTPSGSGIKAALSYIRSHPVYVFYAICIFIILRFLKNRYASPLRHYPGPFFASGTRLWKLCVTLTTHQETAYINLHKKYGPVVRTSPNSLSFASPRAARQILAAPGKGFRKTAFYAVFPPPEHPDIFTETDESAHARKRRVAGPSYAMSAMQGVFAARVDRIIAMLGARLDGLLPTSPNAGGAGAEVDLGAWLHYLAFDVLGEVAFGRPWGFVAEGRDVEGCIAAIDESQRYNGAVGQLPALDSWLRRNPLWKLWQAVVPGAQPLVTRIALEELAKRKPGGVGEKADKGTDLLGQLLKAHEKDPLRFTEGDVFAITHGAIFAGSDSTASTMQSFFHYVLRDPRVHARLVAEIDAATNTAAAADAAADPPAPLISPARGTAIPFSAAQQHLPYLQACLKEAMRLRPAVGVAMARAAPSDDAGEGVDGAGRLPAGTELDVHAWVVHRDRDVFGHDADAFRPERWLESEERARVMDRHMFQFGGGSHVCIGRNLALLEMNKVIPMLLRDYRMELVHPDRELEFHTYFFVVQKGLHVRMARRDRASGEEGC